MCLCLVRQTSSATENSFISNSKKCNIMSQDGTRIPVSTDTREELKSRGSKGDTYNDVVQNLLDSESMLEYRDPNFKTKVEIKSGQIVIDQSTSVEKDDADRVVLGHEEIQEIAEQAAQNKDNKTEDSEW